RLPGPRSSPRGRGRLARTSPGSDARRRVLERLRPDVGLVFRSAGMAAVLPRNHRIHHSHTLPGRPSSEPSGPSGARHAGRAVAGTRLEAREFTSAAARNLTAVARRCLANGWVPDCCLDDAAHPLLHTIAYALRGLLEGGRVLEDTRLIDRAAVAAEHIATTV